MSALPVSTDQIDAFQIWRLSVTGGCGFRRHSRTPLVEPSIVREIPHAMGGHTVEERIVLESDLALRRTV